ncbi:MAG: DUF1992 domain-containing protein [Myxococcales bacterium]|nr:DUF1992 domain-containing protein [Myxococcales bacterium]
MATRLVEDKILQARERGDFDHLEGKGKPLDHSRYFGVPEPMRAAYTLLSNSGFTPPEVELQREIGELRERLARTEDEAERRALSRKIDRKKIKVEGLLRRWQR